jgi:hypothetical protein
MPIYSNTGNSSGTTVEVEVRDGSGGPPVDHHVDVLFSWHRPSASRRSFSPRNDFHHSNESRGVVLWKKSFIPIGTTRTYKLVFNKRVNTAVPIFVSVVSAADNSANYWEVEI